MFIGYVEEIKKILNHFQLNDNDDDQLYYTKIYLNPKLRVCLSFKFF